LASENRAAILWIRFRWWSIMNTKEQRSIFLESSLLLHAFKI
jgi:hypothetical protein